MFVQVGLYFLYQLGRVTIVESSSPGLAGFAYSKMVIIGSRFLVENVLNAQPIMVLAFDTTSSMCFVQVRLFDIITPRSLMYSFSHIIFPEGFLYSGLI